MAPRFIPFVDQDGYACFVNCASKPPHFNGTSAIINPLHPHSIMQKLSKRGSEATTSSLRRIMEDSLNGFRRIMSLDHSPKYINSTLRRRQLDFLGFLSDRSWMHEPNYLDPPPIGSRDSKSAMDLVRAPNLIRQATSNMMVHFKTPLGFLSLVLGIILTIALIKELGRLWRDRRRRGAEMEQVIKL